MPSLSQHHKCKVASPTCFCKPTSLKSSAAGVTLTLTEPIWASIVFSKPVSNPGLDQAPCTVSVGHPNKMDGMCLFWNIHRHKISISWMLVFVFCSQMCILSKGKNSNFFSYCAKNNRVIHIGFKKVLNEPQNQTAQTSWYPIVPCFSHFFCYAVSFLQYCLCCYCAVEVDSYGILLISFNSHDSREEWKRLKVNILCEKSTWWL